MELVAITGIVVVGIVAIVLGLKGGGVKIAKGPEGWSGEANGPSGPLAPKPRKS